LNTSNVSTVANNSAVMSSKNSASNYSTTKSSNSTTSTVASLNLQRTNNVAINDVDNSHVVNTVQGADSIASAAGNNVAVDNSHITNTDMYSVSLAGSAEQNASAINLVNAAGSMVANGVNIARISNMNTTPTLNQVNSISQVH
jgi:hypothetical protein